MQFAKRLRAPIIRGEITASVRIWQKPHVKAGGCYPLGNGHIRVSAIREIALEDVTSELARRTGFEGVIDLLKIAKHGPGERVFLIDFVYRDGPAASSAARSNNRPTRKARRA